jgi:hypothetical protein
MNVSGYVASTLNQWIPIPGGNIGQTKTFFAVPSDNTVELKGLNLTNINGGNLNPAPSGFATGYLVTITLFYF